MVLNDNKCKNRKKGSSLWSLTKCFHQSKGRVLREEEKNNAQDQNWSIEHSNLFIGKKFCHGAHSKLYEGKYKEEHVAVKIIEVAEDNEEEDDDNQKGTLKSILEREFIRETTFLPRLHHQNIVKFIAASKDEKVYIILTEYIRGGSLRSYLNKLESNAKRMALQKVVSFALDIACGMEFVHSKCIIHRDLKPENVLVGDDGHLKIADFGISCEEANYKCDSLSGTYRWMAPEMMKGKKYGRKVDVYSFGLILWEMVSGSVPFKDMSPVQVAFGVMHKNLRPLIPLHVPLVLGDLIQKCWALKPEKRPEFKEVVKVVEQLVN